MKKEEIENILARFYEGQTSEEEEETLRRFFLAADNLPDDLQAERDLFLSMRGNSKEDILVPEELEETLEALIDRKVSVLRRHWLRWGSIAASFLLLVSLGVLLSAPGQEPKDTFTDPEDAHRALQAIFTEMSQTWGEGMAQIEASQRDIMVANREIREEFQQ